MIQCILEQEDKSLDQIGFFLNSEFPLIWSLALLCQ